LGRAPSGRRFRGGHVERYLGISEPQGGMEVEGEGEWRGVEGRRASCSSLTDGNKGRCTRKGKDQIDDCDAFDHCISLGTLTSTNPRYDSQPRSTLPIISGKHHRLGLAQIPPRVYLR
jgi:hypothetical protein